MASDYEKICKDNIRRRGEEFDDIGRLISERLYSDRSHFVFELLQNAEDALARRYRLHPDDSSGYAVRFRLFHDRLEFRHFGIPFDEDDVRGVSDVLKGTKEKDVSQIGKFGIGFKSVYAFTASPEVHSGDEHFVIKRYIRPESKDPDHLLSIARNETVFVFPFDHEDLSAPKAFGLILDKLRRLGPRVLLFMRRIDEIEWRVEPHEEEGHYLKETKQSGTTGNARRITVLGQKNATEDEENWIVFERPVKVPDKSEHVSVEIGYRIETDNKDGEPTIVGIDRSPLVVYFPTQKDTKLGFLIQGPYDPTTSRDNILSDDDWNEKLIAETAELVVDSLQHMKEMGLLSVSALTALPIKFSDAYYTYGDGHYYGEFHPVYTEVRDAFRENDLLPTNDGTFVSARNAKLARGAALLKILNQAKLGELFQSNEDIKWLSDEITQDRTPDLRSYLMQELDIEEVDPEVFVRNLSERFLANQDDEWLIELYKLLVEQKALWRPPQWSDDEGGILRTKPILRLEDGSQVNPFGNDGSPNAYLAVETETETSLPIVKMNLAENKEVLGFLKGMGIPELDIVAEVIEEILPKYANDSIMVDPDENRGDLKKIERAYRTDSQTSKERLRRQLRKTPFILAECASAQKSVYRVPGQVYFATDELRMYFERDVSFTCVRLGHPQSALFKDLGVRETVRIQRQERDYQGHVSITDYHGWHERGLDGFDPDITVDGLECAMSNPTIERSRYIWNTIAVPNSDCIRGLVEKSTRQTYEGSSKSEQISAKFGELLCTTEWLPDTNNDLRKPCEIVLDDLPESFVRDERLANQLGMKKNDVARLAKEIGVEVEDIEFIRQNSEEFGKWKESVRAVKRKTVFPIREVKDPERRNKRLLNQLRDAPEKEYLKMQKSDRVTHPDINPATYLKNQYTNDLNQMICQICAEEMPFRKKNREYYFEAVEALSTAYFPKEHSAQFLALCPVCAARYKEFVKRDKAAMRKFYQAIKHSDQLEVPLKLGELETSIRFVKPHRVDMTTILQARKAPDDTVVDRSDSWSEEDTQDLTRASLHYASTLYPEDEDLV